jgi:Rrf2 family protein
MRFSTQEEYGLRCLLQLARRGASASMSIAEIAQAEGLSQANTAKLMRMLRLAGFVASVRGQEGGSV